MNTIKTMTLDELPPLTDKDRYIIQQAAARVNDGEKDEYDPDCPRLTKEELSQFRPWYELHPDFYKPSKSELHIRIDLKHNSVNL